MLVSPWRRRNALAEVARRKNAAETYTEPLGTEAAQTDQDFVEMKEFMSEFYGQFYTRENKRVRDELLAKNPQVAAHFAVLVPKDVTEEEFWQRYEFRCDEERLLRQWERNPDRGREARAENVAGSVRNLLDASVLAVRNAVNANMHEPPDSSTTHSTSDGARSVQKGGGNDDKVQPAVTSQTEQKLGASLRAAAQDVERWMKQDTDVVAEQVTPKTDVDTGSNSGTGDNNWFAALFRPANAEDKKMTQTEERTARPQAPVNVSRKRSPLPVNSRSESLRDRSKPNARTSAPRFNNSAKGNNEQSQKSVSKRASTEGAQKGLDSAKNVPSPENTVASSHRASSIGIALMVGFLANALLRYLLSTNALCAPSTEYEVPTPWWTPSGAKSSVKALICGDVANQMAVEVVDNSRNGWGPTGGNRKKKKSNRGWNRRHYHNDDEEESGTHHGTFVAGTERGTIQFDEEGGYINSLVSSWMQNADLAQYGDYGGGGSSGMPDGTSSNGIVMANNPSTAGRTGRKSRGVVGFFRKRFGRKSSSNGIVSVAEAPNVVVHQHVHHVVHHVVHEVREA